MKYSILKGYFRKVLADFVYYSDLIHFLGKRRKSAVILAYHKITNKNENHTTSCVPGLSVDAGTFEKHIVYLKKHLKIVSLERLLCSLEDNEDVSNHCVLTFDDGWVDNYENAYPVMKKHDVTGTIFLVTNFVGSKSHPWFEQVARILCDSRLPTLFEPGDFSKYPNLHNIHFFDVFSNRYASRNHKINRVLQKMKELSPLGISRVLSEMSRYLNIAVHSQSSHPVFLSWDQIVTMERNGISFGSHTASHMILTTANESVVKEELMCSKKDIEARLGKQITTFCYPNGNFSVKVRDAVMRAGYRGATIFDKGFVSAENDPFLLPRIGIHEGISSSIPLFACRVEGVPFF